MSEVEESGLHGVSKKTLIERRRLGHTEIAVSALGFGASELGQKRMALKTAAYILGSALDAGLNVIDTAACYGNSEELIGRAVGHRRQDFYILTKCGHASGLRFDDWTPALIEPSIDRSLERLRTDYLDLVQLHSCDEQQLRQGELTAALQRARDKGKLRYIGYSGDGKAALYAAQCGAFDTIQISLSIADQEALTLTLPLARQRQMGVIAKYMEYTLEAPMLHRDLHRLGVQIHTDTMLEKIEPGACHAYNIWNEAHKDVFEVDSVVLCTQRLSNDGLYRELKADILARGLLQNLVVPAAPKPRGSFAVEAGERRRLPFRNHESFDRYRASHRAGPHLTSELAQPRPGDAGCISKCGAKLVEFSQVGFKLRVQTRDLVEHDGELA